MRSMIDESIGRLASPRPLVPLHPQKPQIQELEDEDDDDDGDTDDNNNEPPSQPRGSKAGRHHKGDRRTRFEDEHPPSPLGFPFDTQPPRRPTPLSPPVKPERLRSQSVMTTGSVGAKDDALFKVQEIGFFYPALQIDEKNPEGPFVTTGKDVVYRDVNMFVAAAKRIAKRKTNDVVASHLQLYLRGSALTWFSTLKESMQGALNNDLHLFCEKLFAKYKLRPSQALDKLHNERFTIADAARNRHADEYVQNVVLFGSQYGMTAKASLTMA